MEKRVEKVSTGPLIKGTLAKIKKRCIVTGNVKNNGEPHISKYIEALIYGDLK